MAKEGVTTSSWIGWGSLTGQGNFRTKGTRREPLKIPRKCLQEEESALSLGPYQRLWCPQPSRYCLIHSPLPPMPPTLWDSLWDLMTKAGSIEQESREQQTVKEPCLLSHPGFQPKAVQMMARKYMQFQVLFYFDHYMRLHWRRKWQPTAVLLPRESHGQRSLAGYSPWGR